MSNELGDYRLLEQIGYGASGRVWRAQHVTSGDVIALKVLRSELADDPDARARFLREGDVLANRVLPGVVRVHGTVVDAERVALVMDLVDGSDLRQLLVALGPLPPGRACALLGQVATALAAAHAAGLAHRDVKPENVLVVDQQGGPGTALLTDFGLAGVLGETSTGRTRSQLMGTPHYVAPEVLRGHRAQAPADVYAVGVVLFEVLLGWRPFRAAHPAALMQQHLEERPQRPDDLPDDVWDVVERCLDKDPDRRPTAEVLADQLVAVAAVLADAPALPRTDPPTEQQLTELRSRPGREPAEPSHEEGDEGGPRRRRWLWPAAAAAAVAIAAAAATTATLTGGGSAAVARPSASATASPTSPAAAPETTPSEPTTAPPSVPLPSVPPAPPAAGPGAEQPQAPTIAPGPEGDQNEPRAREPRVAPAPEPPAPEPPAPRAPAPEPPAPPPAKPQCPGEGCEGASPFGAAKCTSDHESVAPIVDVQSSRGDLLAKLQLVRSPRCGTVWAKISTEGGTERRMSVQLRDADGRALYAKDEKDDFVYTGMALARPGACYTAWVAVYTDAQDFAWKKETDSFCS
ncbi:serine/threonine-protein kinase [Kineococcus sp. NUM-3379]